MPVKPFLDYLLLEKKYSLHTHKAYRANLLSFQEFIEQSKPGSEGIEKVAYSEVRSWIVSLIQQGNSTRTVNRKLSVLRSYYKFLVRTGHIEVSPLKEHKALKTATKVPLPFSEKEVNEAIEGDFYSDDYNGVLQKTIVNLLYYTGIRRSELIDLKKVHLDLENKTIKVLGKRNKERLIPLLPQMCTKLTYFLQYQKDSCIPSEDGWVFISPKGKKLTGGFVYQTVQKFFGIVSTKTKKSPHVLRHSFATHLLDQGADINAIKELLGHSSVAATQHYTHSSLLTLKSVYKKAHPREQKNNHH
jgi:integrase/recombinase XerC